MNLGTKIYYTGDMANPCGWFIVSKRHDGTVDLQELPDGFPDAPRTFRRVYEQQIGHEYHGHCGMRFVTADAYHAYRQGCINSMRQSA